MYSNRQLTRIVTLKIDKPSNEEVRHSSDPVSPRLRYLSHGQVHVPRGIGIARCAERFLGIEHLCRCFEQCGCTRTDEIPSRRTTSRVTPGSKRIQTTILVQLDVYFYQLGQFDSTIPSNLITE